MNHQYNAHQPETPRVSQGLSPIAIAYGPNGSIELSRGGEGGAITISRGEAGELALHLVSDLLRPTPEGEIVILLTEETMPTDESPYHLCIGVQASQTGVKVIHEGGEDGPEIPFSSVPMLIDLLQRATPSAEAHIPHLLLASLAADADRHLAQSDAPGNPLAE